MGERIELIARGLVIQGDHVLLCKSLKHNYLYLPGGHIEFGESGAAALAREFREETGLHVRVGELLAVSEGTFEQKQKWRHEVNLVFHVELLDTTHSSLPSVESMERGIAFVWLPLAEVDASDVRPQTARKLLAKCPRPPFEFESDISEPPSEATTPECR